MFILIVCLLRFFFLYFIVSPFEPAGPWKMNELNDRIMRFYVSQIKINKLWFNIYDVPWNDRPIYTHRDIEYIAYFHRQCLNFLRLMWWDLRSSLGRRSAHGTHNIIRRPNIWPFNHLIYISLMSFNSAPAVRPSARVLLQSNIC